MQHRFITSIQIDLLRVLYENHLIPFGFQLIERDGRVSKLRRRDPQYKKLIKSDLVYLEDSPDYCDRDDE